MLENAAIVSADPRWRSEVYAILALGFHKPPGEEIVSRIAAGADKARTFGLTALADQLSELVRCAGTESAETLKIEFNALFMVPGRKYLAPYESVYVDSPIEANNRVSARTFGPSTQQVLAFYKRIGLQIARTYTELPDFVGLELAAMEYLCLREAEYVEQDAAPAAQTAKAMQCTFLRDHLAKWLPALMAQVEKRAETGYYKTLAAITLDWVKDEAGPCSGS